MRADQTVAMLQVAVACEDRSPSSLLGTMARLVDRVDTTSQVTSYPHAIREQMPVDREHPLPCVCVWSLYLSVSVQTHGRPVVDTPHHLILDYRTCGACRRTDVEWRISVVCVLQEECEENRI